MSKPISERGTRRYYPMFELIMARLREFYREPAAIFWVYGFPLLMTLSLGIAFRDEPVQEVVVAVDAGSGNNDTRVQEVAGQLKATSRIKSEILGSEEAERRLRVGQADLVVRPESTSQSLSFVLDPTRPNSLLAKALVNDAIQRAAGRIDQVEVKEVKYAEPGGRYIDFLVPGLIGLGLMGGGMWGVGFAIVDMRIRKLLKRMLATPMSRSQFLGAMMISRLLFTIPEIIILIMFARFAFGVISYGSYFNVGVIILLGSIEFAGLGLLIASRAKTLETVSGLMNLVMLPMWLAAGVFFSSERFPAAIQPIIQVLPLTPVIRSLRAIMLEGASLASQSTNIAIIASWGVVSFTLALLWFRWRD